MIIENLVFSGCGSKIFLFVGVLKHLYNSNKINNIKTIVGTSAGSLVAFFVVLGYNYDSIFKLFMGIKLESILDFDIDNLFQLFDNYGINDIYQCRRILSIVLKGKIGKETISFKELYELTNIKLVICSSNVSKHNTEYFSHETHPDFDVITALEASICIPFIFKPIKINDQIYIDGSVTSHYPMGYFSEDEIEKTLGVLVAMDYYICKTPNKCNNNIIEKIENKIDIKDRIDINNFGDFIFSVLSCPLLKSIQESYEKYKNNTILIINNRNGFNFEIEETGRQQLIDDGFNKCKLFFEISDININKKSGHDSHTDRETNDNAKTENEPDPERSNKYKEVSVQTDESYLKSISNE